MPHTDSAHRAIAQSPTVVFAALVDADARTRWLPPDGMRGRFEWFDARPGGRYRIVLTYDEPGHGKSSDNEDVVDVRFVLVDSPHRIVEEADFISDDPAFAGTMTVTWTIEPTDEGCTIDVTATDVPDGVRRSDHEQAIRSTLANLDHHVTSPSQGSDRA